MQSPFKIVCGDFETICRVVSCRAANKKMTFLVLRDCEQNTLQALLKQKLVLSDESVVYVKGILVAANVTIKSNDTSIKSHELQLTDITVVSESAVLPIQISELNHSSETESIGHSTRLDHRTIDLRSKRNQAIFRVKSLFVQYMSNYLWNLDFMQIQTPKLTSVASEGGAEVFRTEYFGQSGYLVQSPQLYKQMCINADFHKVFEIAPVFRAENSRDSRHLCEFTGVDLEMVLTNGNYHHFLQLVWGMLRHTFFETCRTNLDLVKVASSNFPGVVIPEKMVIVSHQKAIALLKENGYPEIGPYDDLKNEYEVVIGQLVLQHHQSDLVIIERYPKELRPFYTMPCVDDSRYSMSYDILFRGQEICSGSQRIHNYEDLVANANAAGINGNAIAFYLDSFRYGAFPHAGAGFGLERLVARFLQLSSVQYASLFPRTPNRLTP